jgi:Flp pilus assembly protein TadG
MCPLLMLLTLGIIQAGIYLHGRNVAQRAATSAVDVSRGSFGTAAEAERIAASVAHAGGLRNVQVRVSRGSAEVVADVSARPVSILDMGLFEVHETARAPRERVTQP